MKKKYKRPHIDKLEIVNEDSIATASIVTGGTGSTPLVEDELPQESQLEKWEFNL